MDNNTLVLWVAWESDKKIPFPFMAPYGFSMAQACDAAQKIYSNLFVTVQMAFYTTKMYKNDSTK